MSSQKRIHKKVRQEYNELLDNSDEKIVAFEKQKRRKKKRTARRRKIWLMLVLVALLLGTYAFLPISKISIINVYDNKFLSDEQILDMSGLVPEQSSYAFMIRPLVKRKMEESPFISQVEIKKGRGRQIDLHVTERQIVFRTVVDDKTMVYFADGTFTELSDGYTVDVSVLHGITAPKSFDYVQLAKQFGVVPKEITEQISEIIFSPVDLNGQRYLLLMTDGNRIVISQQNITTFLKWYDYLIHSVGDQKGEFNMEYIVDLEKEKPVIFKPF